MSIVLPSKVTRWAFMFLVLRVAATRPPDVVIGEDSPEGPYLLRWYLTPWRRWLQTLPDGWLQWPARAARLALRLLPNLYLHKFMRDDDDRANHDHPSFALSWLLHTGYLEHTIDAGGIKHRRFHPPGSLRFMGLFHAHRIELLRVAQNGVVRPVEAARCKATAAENPLPTLDDPAAPCWSLFLFGPRLREWGFHCPDRGWVHWEEFTKPGRPGEIGPGCD